MSSVPVVTVDGPSGSGKGTVGRQVASALGWHFLDSGALYRVLAFAALERALDLADGATVAALAATLEVSFSEGDEVYLSGQAIGPQLRTEQTGNAASRIAALPEVRAALLDWQRSFRRAPGLVADGRDMGTVVFPDAVVKIFLTANAQERANRRYKQLKEKGLDASIAGLLREIEARDARDGSRAVSPLRPARDAVTVDSSDLAIETVVADILELVRDRVGQG